MTNEELALQIRAGNTALYCVLWEQVYKLIQLMVNKYMVQYHGRFAKAGLEQDDLMQLGYFAVMDAVEAFDETSEYKFSSYINLPLKNKINEALGIRTSRRDPLNNCISLDMPLDDSDEGDATLLNTVKDTCTDIECDISDKVFNEQLRVQLDRCIDTLPEQVGSVIRESYFNGKTVAEIAKKENCTVEQVKRMKQKGLHALRSRRQKELIGYYREIARDDIIFRGSYRSGASRFRDFGASSVELTTEKLDRLGQRIFSKNSYWE